MIKPNDLRIGNWVNFEGTYIEINGVVVNKHGTHIYYNDDYCLFEEGSKLIAGIQLTDDIIAKSGLCVKDRFKNIDGNFTNVLFEIKEDIYIRKYYQDKNLYIITAILNVGDGRDGDMDIDVDISKIRYVHQLQNIYWTLCGEELKIDST